MTVEEYVTLVGQVRGSLYNGLRANLPEPCQVVNRFILSGAYSDEEWIAGLLNAENKVRILVILMAETGVGLLGGTAGARSFDPRLRFNLELYHSYQMGTDTDNSEAEFLADASRVTYSLGKNRALAGHLIESGSLRLGIRPSKIQALHFGKGEVIVNLKDVRYQ